MPGQTLNVALCFVPATHETAARLPAVSGSSGRLVVSPLRQRASTEDRTWPGHVFEETEQEYAVALHAFVAASAPRYPLLNQERERQRQARESEECSRLRTLRREERALAHRRSHLHQQHTLEDAAWRTLYQQRQARVHTSYYTPAEWTTHQAEEAHWLAIHAQRRMALEQRRAEDIAWRQERKRFNKAPARAWVAVLAEYGYPKTWRTCAP